VDRSSWRTLYASRALCQPLRVHRVGPLVCSPATSEPTGVPASTRRMSHPALHGPSSLGARAARPPWNRPASARPDDPPGGVRLANRSLVDRVVSIVKLRSVSSRPTCSRGGLALVERRRRGQPVVQGGDAASSGLVQRGRPCSSGCRSIASRHDGGAEGRGEP
jgi:hypothetical protein